MVESVQGGSQHHPRPAVKHGGSSGGSGRCMRAWDVHAVSMVAAGREDRQNCYSPAVSPPMPLPPIPPLQRTMDYTSKFTLLKNADAMQRIRE